MDNEWHTANTMNQDCGVTSVTGRKEVIERADAKSLKKCRIRVQRTSYKLSRPGYMLRPSISAIASRLSAWSSLLALPFTPTVTSTPELPADGGLE